ncbi:MAG: hypothetical protein UMS36scaffold28_57 [Phage 59_13]|nr:MAG: hypothetical protein UMS36scaffold28_57 [Phage 59_13]
MDELRQEMFEYLDELREQGITNMYGAGPYLQKEFLLDRQTARAVLQEWMLTFEERQNKTGGTK